MNKNLTLREVFEYSVKNYSDNKAFSDVKGAGLTYRDFALRVAEATEMLLNAGISSGDRVAIFSRSTIFWPVAYFACVNNGIIAVPILPDFTPKEVEKLLTHAGAKALFASEALYESLPETLTANLSICISTEDLHIYSTCTADSATSSTVEADAVTTDSATSITVEADTAAATPSDSATAATPSDIAVATPEGSAAVRGSVNIPTEEDLAVIIYTSGTTSSPKGVMLSHKALCTQLKMYEEFFPISPDDIFLSLLPLSHTYECSIGMLYPFASGAQVVYLDRLPSAPVLIPALKKVRPTILICVPLIMEKIYRTQVLGKVNAKKSTKALYRLTLGRKLIHRKAGSTLKQVFGGRLRFLAFGGAKLNTQTDRFLHESGLPYAVGYGLTETAPLLFASVPGKCRIGSTGYVISPVQARLDNVNPQTGEGELVVKTPCVMKGYYLQEEMTKDVFTKDGWFRTKDICRMDKDGYLYVKGRCGNMIVGASGENIYPEEIENILNSHFLVNESLVVKDKNGLTAIVVYEEDKLRHALGMLKGSEEEKMAAIHAKIRNYVNSRVNSFSRISNVEDRMEPFVKTPSSKIKRFLYLKDCE